MAGHITKRGGRYLARFPLGARGRFRSRTFDRKTDADRWLREQTAARDQGDWIDPKGSGEPFRETAERWLSRREGTVKPATVARDRSILDNWVLPSLGSTPLRQIDGDTMAAMVETMTSAGRSPSTVSKAHHIARMVLSEAVGDRLLARLPAPVRLPQKATTEQRFLTIAEVGDLAAAIDPRYSLLVWTAGLTGLRWGELAGLKRRYLDLDAAEVTVALGLSEVNGVFRLGRPKTSASRRTVTLPASLVDRLRSHVEGMGEDDLIFTDADGGYLRRSNFRRRVWLPAVAASVGGVLRFHDLRHSHAAHLVKAGTHAKTIQSRLGHANITTTLNTYGHLMAGLDSEAARALDVLIEGSTRDALDSVQGIAG